VRDVSSLAFTDALKGMDMKSTISLLVMTGVLMGCATTHPSGEVRSNEVRVAPVWRQALPNCQGGRDVLVCQRDPAQSTREACKCMSVHELARSHNFPAMP
jgi:hypothetical protein